MRLGLALPQYDYAVAGQPRLPWATVAEYAAQAERLGFSSLWLADHLFLSLEKYGGSGDPSAATAYGVNVPRARRRSGAARSDAAIA